MALQLKGARALGGGGHLYARVPRVCLGADPSGAPIERKANVTVSTPGRSADVGISTDRYVDFVSITKFKTSTWTSYLKN